MTINVNENARFTRTRLAHRVDSVGELRVRFICGASASPDRLSRASSRDEFCGTCARIIEQRRQASLKHQAVPA